MATDGFRPLPSHYDRCFGCGRDHPTGLHLEVDFRRPVPVGSRLELHARVDRREGRKIWASLRGRVDDEVAVEAEALYVMVGLEHFVPHAERMGERMAERPTTRRSAQDPKP